MMLYLKTELVHENQHEFIISVEDETVRLPRTVVEGVRMLPTEDNQWFEQVGQKIIDIVKPRIQKADK